MSKNKNLWMKVGNFISIYKDEKEIFLKWDSWKHSLPDNKIFYEHNITWRKTKILFVMQRLTLVTYDI